jgi:hypothetical protein
VRSGAALSSEVPDDRAGKLALELIREVDPVQQATVEVTTDVTNEDIKQMSWSELRTLATALGMDVEAFKEEYYAERKGAIEGAIEGAIAPPTPPESAQPGDPEAE